MACKGCGYCCTVWIGKEGFAEDPRIAKWRNHFVKSVVVDGVRYNVMENACKHLRGAKCSIYDRRPQMCRDFPANDEIKKVWKAIHPECGMV